MKTVVAGGTGRAGTARRLFAAIGDERTVVSGGTYFGAELTGTELTPEPGASRIGPTGFDAWVAAQNFPRPQPAR